MNPRATIVIGLGATGYSCIRHLAPGNRVQAIDTRPAPPYLDAVQRDHADVEVLPPRRWRDALRDAQRVVVSPGIALDHCLVATARAAGVAITSDIELFLAAAAAPVVGITGTNGKSTVATLVGQLLAEGGANIGVGGNLGTPALELLADDSDGYVLELSSFQLERLHRPGLAVGAVLNVSADHLDRYASLDAYAASKRRIYRGAARVVFNALDPRTVPEATDVDGIALHRDPRWRIEGDQLVIDGERLPTGALAMQGRHNHCNALAAAAIAHQAGRRIATASPVLRGFRGLPHRAAVVAEGDGVTYVDDSKATNVGACLAALEGFGNSAGNIVLIAGGDAKGASFDALRSAVARHVRHLVLLGRDADRIAQVLAGATPTSRATDMREAVRLARANARPGNIVLLSPACASFDMYPDYRARGDDFAAHAAAAAGEDSP